MCYATNLVFFSNATNLVFQILGTGSHIYYDAKLPSICETFDVNLEAVKVLEQSELLAEGFTKDGARALFSLQ